MLVWEQPVAGAAPALPCLEATRAAAAVWQPPYADAQVAPMLVMPGSVRLRMLRPDLPPSSRPPLRPPAPAQLLELDVELEQGPKYAAIDKWAQQLHSLHAQVAAKLAA